MWYYFIYFVVWFQCIEQNIRQNFEAIIACEPEKAQEASHRHLAFIKEILLDISREHTRRERSLRRIQQYQNLI